MENVVGRIFRHESPTMQDTAPYGTECKVDHAHYFEIYLQLSCDEENPRWVQIGEYKHGTDDVVIEEDIFDILNPE